MSDEMKVVACTSCGARLKVRSAAQRVKCSKCNTSFEVASATASPTNPMTRAESASSQRPVASQSSAPSPKTESAESLGFFAYVWSSYNRTHSTLPFLLAVILSLLLMPVLSFLKPKIGVSAVIWSFGITLGVSLALFVVLVVIASSRYLFLKQRTISDDQRSWLSAFICFLGMLAPALGIVAAAESFSPAEGLFVKLIPQFKAEQVRLLGDVAENSEEQPSESNDTASQVVSAESESSTKGKSADSDGRSNEVALADTKSSGRAKQAKSKSESSNEDGGQEAERPSKKTTQKTKTSNSKAASSDSDPKTQEIIAEGVGATADEAIKDAYRNAVRQVVGAVVDAETLVKNDEIIDDKVLTYSDGFIKGYEEVDGSKKVKGGLHRIKIKAQVERRSVIAKLKAANVTVKEVDGKGLFAEAVTQLDAEKDAEALLKKQFEGFPQSCITATVIGKPELVSKTGETATVKITVQIEPDLKAYKVFSGKLIPILDKLAKSKGEFTAKYGKSTEGRSDYLSAIVHLGFSYGMKTWMPKLFHDHQHFETWKEDQVSVAVATNRTKSADSIDYKYYTFDPSLEIVFKALALREGHCKLQLLDAEGEIVATDPFEPTEWLYGGGPKFDGSLVVAIGRGSSHYATTILTRNDYTNDQKSKLFLLCISPVFSKISDLKTTLTISRLLTLSLDELKSVKDVKVEITFDE